MGKIQAFQNSINITNRCMYFSKPKIRFGYKIEYAFAEPGFFDHFVTYIALKSYSAMVQAQKIVVPTQ